MKILIVESKTKARTIAKFLKGFYLLATYGHLLDLPKREFGIYLENGKIKAKYIPIKGKNKIIQRLKKLISKAKEIYIASDPDREGEMIAKEIEMITNKNNLKRIVFHEITQKAILKALEKPEKIREDLVNAQKARRFLDRIFGYTLSPILWRNIEKALSAGRVQSVALRLIVEREREIRSFKKEIYYLVLLKLKNFDFNVYLVDEKLNYLKIKEKDLKEWKEKLKNLKNLKLKEIIEKENSIYPPLPLDTENLQRYAYQFLKFPPKKTMFIAQKLFELGKITYHRTDSHKINLDFSLKLKSFIEKEYGQEYFSSPRKIKEKLSFEAHEAIRPINFQENLTNDYLKLWQLIWLITLASHFKPAKYKNKKIIFQDLENRYYFLSSVDEPLFDGFLKVFPYKKKFDKLPENLPSVFQIKKIIFKKEETKPPPRYNETSLIKELKKLGIGRPSTYVPIIEILGKRKYVIKEKNYLKPTELGERVFDFLIKNFQDLIEIDFTAKMENFLDKIALGKENYEKFIIDFWKKLKS